MLFGLKTTHISQKVGYGTPFVISKACEKCGGAVETASAQQRDPRLQYRRLPYALTPMFVRNVTKAGRYCDGNGLYLQVHPTGSRNWVQRIIIRGRRRELGLGGFPLVSLAEAREAAFTNRKLAREGGDPLAERRRANGMPTFEAAAQRVWKDKHPAWRNAQHTQDWMSTLRRYVFPHIGRLPVSEVSSAGRAQHAAGASGTTGPRRRGACAGASVRCWSGPWQWSCGRTIRAIAWRRCWNRNRTSCNTCGRCRTARWLRP